MGRSISGRREAERCVSKTFRNNSEIESGECLVPNSISKCSSFLKESCLYIHFITIVGVGKRGAY